MNIIVKSGQEKPKILKKSNKIPIDIKLYINKYEKGEITVEEIAENEGVSKNTINSRINEYYKKNGQKRPKQSKKSNKIEIEIEPYINDYNEGKITISEIAKKEKVSESTIDKRIAEYYNEKRTGKT